ncbi:MAG TPA: ABC transporter substrate-binding protein [Candidatus Limnocylindria bacterium]|nr:ABC transporter substrate-binding protein [Candidatus Limnocylindria bacterium]
MIVAACGGGGTGGGTTTAAPTAAGTQAQGQLPKPEVTTIRIGISTPNEPVQFAEKLADSLGIYQKYGFTNVTVTGFEGDGKTLQALVAGQLDFMVGGASTAVTSVISDTPLKLIAMNSTVLTDGLYCTSAIKTPADVKGKSVAISTFGGTSHGAALLMVQGVGLTPRDVEIRQVGNQGTRIAALKGGSVGCAVVDKSQDKAMKDQGFNLVFDLSTAKLQWGRSGLQGKADFIAKNPNTTLVVVAATLEAQNSIWKDPATAATKFAEFAQIKPEDARKAIDDFQGYGSRSMQFTEDALKAPKEVLSTQNPALAGVDLSKAYDLSFLKKLVEIGFNAKIGAPTN